MTTLSPCPFCGGEARFGQSSPAEDNDYAGAEYIECMNARCFATTACMFPCMQDVKPLLAERWNKRAAHEQARGQPEDLIALRKDAQRYRWLREQNWHDGPLTVVRSPREAIRLGYDCPSLSRLDEFIDEFRAALAGAGESK